MLPTDDEEDARFFEQFAVLRDAAVELIGGFEERVRGRLDEVDTSRRGNVGGMIASALVELFNVSARISGYRGDDEEVVDDS
jgi:hypothetical protein